MSAALRGNSPSFYVMTLERPFGRIAMGKRYISRCAPSLFSPLLRRIGSVDQRAIRLAWLSGKDGVEVGPVANRCCDERLLGSSRALFCRHNSRRAGTDLGRLVQ